MTPAELARNRAAYREWYGRRITGTIHRASDRVHRRERAVTGGPGNWHEPNSPAGVADALRLLGRLYDAAERNRAAAGTGRQRNRPARYCAVCDSSYLAGAYAAHRATFRHTASMADRASMARWYAGNAAALAPYWPDRVARGLAVY